MQSFTVRYLSYVTLLHVYWTNTKSHHKKSNVNTSILRALILLRSHCILSMRVVLATIKTMYNVTTIIIIIHTVTLYYTHCNTLHETCNGRYVYMHSNVTYYKNIKPRWRIIHVTDFSYYTGVLTFPSKCFYPYMRLTTTQTNKNKMYKYLLLLTNTICY